MDTDNPFEEEEATQVIRNPLTQADLANAVTLVSPSGPISVVLRNIPFGSWADKAGALRIDVDRGHITARKRDGTDVPIDRLHPLEQAELFAHVEWWLSTRAA